MPPLGQEGNHDSHKIDAGGDHVGRPCHARPAERVRTRFVRCGGTGTGYSATLSGDSEVPDAVTTSATGSFSATLDGDSLTFSLEATGEGITQAHIHMGPASENGPVVAFLFGLDEAGVNMVEASGTITEAELLGPLEGNFAGLVEALEAGNLYVNVHFTREPGRGDPWADRGGPIGSHRWHWPRTQHRKWWVHAGCNPLGGKRGWCGSPRRAGLAQLPKGSPRRSLTRYRSELLVLG